MLVNEFTAKNFDVAFKIAAAQASPNNAQFSAVEMANKLYSAIQPWSPGYSYSQVWKVVSKLPENNPNLPPSVRTSMVQSSLGQLSNNGATAWMSTAYGVLNDLSVHPSEVTSCAFLHTVIWFLTIVAALLTFMCVLPKPAIVVICPAAAIMGVIAGILATIQLFACGSF